MTHYLKTNWDLNAAELVEVFDELPLWAAPFGLKLLNGIKYKNFIRLAFIDGWKSIVPSNRQFEVFERIELELNRKSAIEGMLVLSVPFATIDCKKL